MKVLAIGGHGDDIEFGCGGTLFKKREKDEDLRLYMGVVTLNAVDPIETPTRIAEGREAGTRLGGNLLTGSDEFVVCDLPHKPVIELVDGWVSEISPDEIFVHWKKDSNQDHVLIARAVFAATRRSSVSVFMYESMTSIEFTPTIFVDITAQMKKKEKLLRLFASQQTRDRRMKGFDLIKRMHAAARYHGVIASMECCEGFVPYRVTKKW